MRAVDITGPSRANGHTDKFVGKSDGDGGHWFARACGAMGIKGIVLHFLTGFRERDCERYAEGSVRPPAYFLRALLRSDEGWIWLEVVMDGSQAKWWLDLKRARRVAEALKE